MKNAGLKWLIFSVFFLLSACIAEDEDLLHSDWAIFYGMGSRPLALRQQYNVNKAVVSFDSILISSGNTVFAPATGGESTTGSKINMRLQAGSDGRLQPLTCHLLLRADLDGDGQAETPVSLEIPAGNGLRQLARSNFRSKKMPANPQVELDLLRLLAGIDWRLAADDSPRARQTVQRQLENNLPGSISWREGA